MWTGLVSYLEIPDKAKWPKLILVSILGRKQHDRKASRGAASTEHWQGILLLHPNLWGGGTRALQPSDLTPAATDLAAAKPVLSVPEFLLPTGIYLLCPCAWAVLISSLQMVLAAPLPLRFPSPGPQPLAGNQKTWFMDCSLCPTPGQSVGPCNCPLDTGHLSLPAIHREIINTLGRRLKISHWSIPEARKLKIFCGPEKRWL